jgi:hypothetical protein
MSSIKQLVVTAALAAPAPFLLPSLPVNAATSAAMCQPLSASNLEECCAAEDWRDIIRQGDVRFCPPLNSNDQASGRLGEVLPPGGSNPPGGEEPPTTGSINGNPGNAEPVGMSGEKPDKGMAETDGVSGVKGKSN